MNCIYKYIILWQKEKKIFKGDFVVRDLIAAESILYNFRSEISHSPRNFIYSSITREAK